MSGAYYNEHDPLAAAWLRELIKDGLIAPGDVDERDIQQVAADDIRPFRQAHFFAGIGGWSHALRLAGWPDDRPVWTGSCPCQPFSAAGKRKGAADERHLWPAFFNLIRECRPDVVFGEQVESAIRMGWLDGIRADLEAEGYALGAAVLGAHSVGAPHIRQRLYWVADAGCERRDGEPVRVQSGAPRQACAEVAGSSERGGMADASGARAGRDAGTAPCEEENRSSAWRADGQFGGDASVSGGAVRGLEHAASDGRQQRRPEPGQRGAVVGCGESGLADAQHNGPSAERKLSRAQDKGRMQQSQGRCAADGGLGDTDDARPRGRLVKGDGAGQWSAGQAGMGHWSAAEWLTCSDGKARRVEPGIFSLAYGVSGRVDVVRPGVEVRAPLPEEIRQVSRVGTLRGAGNAIVPQVAAQFIGAWLDASNDVI